MPNIFRIGTVNFRIVFTATADFSLCDRELLRDDDFKSLVRHRRRLNFNSRDVGYVPLHLSGPKNDTDVIHGCFNLFQRRLFRVGTV